MTGIRNYHLTKEEENYQTSIQPESTLTKEKEINPESSWNPGAIPSVEQQVGVGHVDLGTDGSVADFQNIGIDEWELLTPVGANGPLPEGIANEETGSVKTGSTSDNAAKAWTSGWWKTEEGQKWSTGIAIFGKALDALRKGIEARKAQPKIGKMSKKKKKKIRSRYA